MPTLRRTALVALSLGTLFATAGCEAQSLVATPALASVAAGFAPLVAESATPKGKRRGQGKKRRFQDAPVYVDGAFQGMLKYAELPPALPTLYKTYEDDDKVVRRFAWTHYFAALGIDVAQIEAVHFHGGRDAVCVVDGDELRRVGESFRFSFTRATSGFPRLEIPEDGIRYNTFVDKLRGVAVYVKKAPPSYDFRDGLRMPDGTQVEKGFAYATGERHGGTRVYLDGRLVNVFHRRALDPESQRERGYDFAAALRGFGVDVDRVKRVQMVGPRDVVAADLDRAALAEETTFDVPRGSHGRILMTAASSDPIDAVLLYSTTEPADRSLSNYPGGSKHAHQGTQEANDSAARVAAHRVHDDSNGGNRFSAKVAD